MKSVSRFEANLLRLLYYFLQQAPVQQALPLLEAKIDRPKCLGRDAVDLVKDALGKGCMLLLVRLGGWRRDRFLRNEKPVEGRLWERTRPQNLGLSFSRNTLDFLVWVTAKKPTEDKKGWQPPLSRLTEGDLLLLYFAHEALRGNDMGAELLKRQPMSRHGLCWLAFPDDYARASVGETPDFGPWTTGIGSCVLEALQPALAERWINIEVDKGRITGWQQMRDLGQAQERALEGILQAIEAAGRLDLGRFLLQAAHRLVTPSATPEMWTGSLRQHAPRLADRADTYRGALALLRQMHRLQQWERNARSVGYFDEGYAASQLWKADWERFQGDEVTERAQSIIRQLDPMRQTEGRT
jgi:FtsH ternary system domain X6